MSVHYKFKSALDFDTITFDGLHISVNDLKKAITHQKRLGKTSDFDLQITNAQTKEEYTENSTLIPKNTSLIIARIPLAVQPKKPWDPLSEKIQIHRLVPEPERGELDLSQMNGSEEDKIQAMMVQSTMDYDPNKYQKLRGQGQTGEVPASYRCFKCHKPGHWIKNCPLNTSIEFDHKRNTGIPRSFLQERDTKEKASETVALSAVAEKRQEIPEDLICGICKDLFTDAVMIPCCGSSFCDECVRTALLESEDNECPDCNEKGSSPGSLIPNRFLRNSVNAFKNETGYNKLQKRKEMLKVKENTFQPQIELEEKNNLQNAISNVLSDEKIKTKLLNKEKLVDAQEKKPDTHSSSHDENESDFEDNITVTVPPPFVQSHRSALQERPYNGRYARNPRPPGMENSPRKNLQSSPSQEHETRNSISDEIGACSSSDNIDQHRNHHITSNVPVQRESVSSIRVHRSTSSEMYANVPAITSYPQNMPGALVAPGPGPLRHYSMHNYGLHNSGYSQYNMGERIRHYLLPRPGFHGSVAQMRPRHIIPSSNLESVYQGVAAKVGTGIIDDPLEAFNRIMREKEKRKEERRRSPERRRSHSTELRAVRGRHSPNQHSRMRQRTPEDRRGRSPHLRDRRGRSRNRIKRINEIDKRKHHSSSFSDRSSRSRSWSNLPRRRSKTPSNIRKRSRSRSPINNPSRSRSRSNSQTRFRGHMMPVLRYNRSPLRSVSPRYRQKEMRNRRDDRDCSPYHGIRRPRSRGRSPVNQYNRHDKPVGLSQDHYNYNTVQTANLYNAGTFARNNNKRYSRERQINPKRNEQFNHERNIDFKGTERYDEAPPGTVEPPPPGFEISPQHDRSSWNQHTFDEHISYKNDYRKPYNENEKCYKDRLNSPDIPDKDTDNGDPREMHRYKNTINQRDVRSWSRSSIRSSNANINRVAFERKRQSRSRSVTRGDRIPGSTREFSSSKEKRKDRNTSADQNYEVNDKSLKERAENEEKKRDKVMDRSREKKTIVDYSKEGRKNSSERKPEKNEKEDRLVNVKEKDKERNKEKLKEFEKDKRKDVPELDTDKKDKKIKDKKKKRKEEKEAKRKLKKKEKKEKEKDKVKLKDLQEILKNENVNDGQIPIDEIPKGNSLEKDIQTKVKDLNSVSKQDIIASNFLEEQQEVNVIDLYADICQDEEIKYDYMNTSAESGELVDEEKNSLSDIKRFDSVLDLNPDLDDLYTPDFDIKQATDGVLVPLPEPSKWELDDDGQNGKEENKMNSAISEDSDAGFDKSGKVTTEVIKRAENAIFKRAINAIRPSIEIKTISVERQKLYSNENKNDMSLLSTSLKPKSDEDDHHYFQITVPVNNNTNDRSVELKSEKSNKQTTTTKSVKDRLGPVLNRKSSTISPTKIFSEAMPSDKCRSSKSQSNDRNGPRMNDEKRSADRNKFKEADNSKKKNTIPRSQQKSSYDSDRRSRRQFPDPSKEPPRDSELRDLRRHRNYSKDSFNRNDREHLKDRFTGRDKLMPRSYSRDNKKNKDIESKRQRSRSHSLEKHEKRLKREKEERNKIVDEKPRNQMKKLPINMNNKTEFKDKTETSNKTRISAVENEVIDNKSFKQDIESEKNRIKNNLGEKSFKDVEYVKQTSSLNAASSSSSSCSGTDSGSESEDKKKKKRKHKKEKRRTKRSSSAESNTSASKRKRSKSKKKNKSSKKKKKNKK